MSSFNFATINAIKTPAKAPSSWKKNLTLAALLLSLAGAEFGASKLSSLESISLTKHHGISIEKHKTEFLSPSTLDYHESAMIADGTPYRIDNDTEVFDVNPSDNNRVMSDQAQKNAFDSTVMILALDENNTVIHTASGTIIAEHDLYGAPVVASVAHVTETSLRLLVLNHDGKPLGYIKQIPGRSDQTDCATISYFEPSGRNNAAIRSIKGVQIANEIPAGMMFGKDLNQVVIPGASGGGWYNAQGQLVGVVVGTGQNDNDKKISINIEGRSLLRSFYGMNPNFESHESVSGTSFIQTLASGRALSQLEAFDRSPDPSRPKIVLDSVIGGFGFGFPDYIPHFFKGDMKYNAVDAQDLTKEFSRLLQANQHNP
jgi:hypothetical protein